MSQSKEIGIIGGGVGGVCAARRCLETGYPVTVLEQSDRLFGIWNYDKPGSPVYERLILNSPNQFMTFKNFPQPEHYSDKSSFMTREQYYAYLQSFAEPMKNSVLFEHKVIQVIREGDKWKILVQVKSTPVPLEFFFDVIFVCVGGCQIPDIPSYAKKYQKPWMHSKYFHDASEFKGKTVGIVGGLFSANDMADHLSKVAKKIFICHRNCPFESWDFASNVEQKPMPIDATPNSLILSDNTKLTDLDVVIYGTGWKYAFPFLDPELLQVSSDGKVVSPLFYHVAQHDYPNSFFVLGLMTCCIPLPLVFDSQLEFILSLMEKDPDELKKVLSKWEPQRFSELKHIGLGDKYFHTIDYQFVPFDRNIIWNYFKELSEIGGNKYRFTKAYEKMFVHWIEDIVLHPASYRKYKYRIRNEDKVEVEWDNGESHHFIVL